MAAILPAWLAIANLPPAATRLANSLDIPWLFMALTSFAIAPVPPAAAPRLINEPTPIAKGSVVTVIKPDRLPAFSAIRSFIRLRSPPASLNIPTKYGTSPVPPASS